MITIGEFENFITKNICYEQRIISIIDDLGRQIFLEDLGQLHKNYGKTIKIESMEKYNQTLYNYCEQLKKTYNHFAPITCHAFRSFENSKSFSEHTDPDDVFLFVIFGEKKMIVDNVEVVLREGDTFFIPSNTKHQAINEKESLMLSFGLENFLVDKSL